MPVSQAVDLGASEELLELLGCEAVHLGIGGQRNGTTQPAHRNASQQVGLGRVRVDGTQP